MKRLVILAALLLVHSMSCSQAFAQTATPTPNCCQVAVWTPVPTCGVDGNAAVVSGTLFVCDSTHDQLISFSLASGNQTGTIPMPSGTNPYGLAAGNDGYLYVGGYAGRVILKVLPGGGAAVTVVSGTGLVRALSMDPDSGDIYVVFQAPDEAKVLKRSLAYVDDNTVLPGSAGNVNSGIWAASGGFVYLSGNGGNVVKFLRTGSYNFSAPVTVADISTVVGPCNVAVDAMGFLYIASFGSARYVVMDPGNGYAVLNDCAVPDNSRGIAVDGGSGDVFMTATDKIFKASHCWSIPLTTPTPSYKGADPPGPGQCFLYPSPARGASATLSYSMAEPGGMEFKVWNQNGELAAEVRDRKPAGIHITPLSLVDFASGVYYYRVQLTYDSGRTERIGTKKFVVIH